MGRYRIAHVLARERSFAGRVGTGMATLCADGGFHALFGSFSLAWVPKAIATIFLLIAIFVFLSAERRACRILDNLDPHNIAVVKPIRIRLLSWALAATTTALGAALRLRVRI